MDAIVLGAGIAGLTAAYHLKQKGLKVCLLEKSGRWGGCLHTVRQNGYLLEKGPNSFLEGQETLWRHVEELGLQDQVIPARPSARKRFVLKGGRLVPFPTSPVSFLTTPLLTVRGKARFFLEPFIPARRAGKEEESVARFVTRRLGKEALNLVEPMIKGIYAGNSEALSLPAVAPRIAKWEREYGSLFKALRKARLFSKGGVLYSFKNGMQTLADALYEKVKGDCRLNVSSLQIGKRDSLWQANETQAPRLILAAPAYEAAGLLTDVDPALAGLLDAIPYAPLAVIHLIVNRTAIRRPLDGFGFLAGADAKDSLLGCLWSSCVFEGRCEDSKVLMTCYAGAARSEKEAVEKTVAELRRIFRSGFEPQASRVTFLPKAIPQYFVGHSARLEKIRRRLENLPGLYLVGSYWNGISVNDTMKTTLQSVQEIC